MPGPTSTGRLITVSPTIARPAPATGRRPVTWPRVRAVRSSMPRSASSSRMAGAGGVAEDPQRLALGRHERDRRLRGAARPGRGHDRQLVGGKRPRRAGGHHDDDLPAMAARDLGEHPFDHRHVGGSAERQRARERGLRARRRPRPAGGRSRARRRSRGAPRRRSTSTPASSPSTSVTSYRRASSWRSSGGGARARTAPRPRRGGARARARGEELDLEVAAGQVAQREDGLHGRDSGAGDENPMRHEDSVPRPVLAHIRATPPPVAGELRSRCSRRPGWRPPGIRVPSRHVSAPPQSAIRSVLPGVPQQLACPMDWAPRDDAHWHIELRCGDCGHRWELDVHDSRAATVRHASSTRISTRSARRSIASTASGWPPRSRRSPPRSHAT